jgi:hypothetical protein
VDRPDLELLRGAIDMHAHTAPALFRRHIDDAALAEFAISYGMRGFVLLAGPGRPAREGT